MDKVDQQRAYKGQKGTYLNVRLVLQDSVDSYGNIGFLVQETSAEEYKAGVRLPICGSVKERVIASSQSSQPVQPAPVPTMKQAQQTFQAEVFDSNDLPF